MSNTAPPRRASFKSLARLFEPAGGPPARIAPAADRLKPLTPVEMSPEDQAVIAAAAHLPDGAPCDGALRAAIDAEIRVRREMTDTSDGPNSPKVCKDLRVRKAGLPDWWEAGGNLLLCGPGAAAVDVSLGMMNIPASGAIAIIGELSTLPRLNFQGPGGLVVVGDEVFLNASAINMTGRSTVLIGEKTTATWMASVDARNGGIVVIGEDGMWAAGTGFMTDDTHAIRDAKTGARVNRYGGRIVIERHVWLGEQVKVMGDTWIGHDAIVGMGSFVKNTVLPPHTVSAGRPAKPGRTGITWARADLP